MVCPALWPPWYRTTIDISLASRSVSLPLPSSPHWVPTTTVPGTRFSLDSMRDYSEAYPSGGVGRAASPSGSAAGRYGQLLTGGRELHLGPLGRPLRHRGA